MDTPNNIRAAIRTEVIDSLRSLEIELNSCVRDQYSHAFHKSGIYHGLHEIYLRRSGIDHAADSISEWLYNIYFQK